MGAQICGKRVRKQNIGRWDNSNFGVEFYKFQCSKIVFKSQHILNNLHWIDNCGKPNLRLEQFYAAQKQLAKI